VRATKFAPEYRRLRAALPARASPSASRWHSELLQSSSSNVSSKKLTLRRYRRDLSFPAAKAGRNCVESDVASPRFGRIARKVRLRFNSITVLHIHQAAESTLSYLAGCGKSSISYEFGIVAPARMKLFLDRRSSERPASLDWHPDEPAGR